MFRSKSLLCFKKAALISSKIASKSNNTSWAKKFNQENKYLFGNLLESQADRKKRIAKEKVNTELNFKSHLCQDTCVNFPFSSDGICNVHAASDNINIGDRFGKVLKSCHIHTKQSFSDHAVRKNSSSFIRSVPKECVTTNNFEVRFSNKSRTLGFRNEFQCQPLNNYKNNFIDPNFQLMLPANDNESLEFTGEKLPVCADKSKSKILNFSDVIHERKVDCRNSRSCESFFYKHSTLHSVSRGLFELSAKCKCSFMKKLKAFKCAPFLSFHTNSIVCKQNHSNDCNTDGMEDKTNKNNNNSQIHLNNQIASQSYNKIELESGVGKRLIDLSACSERENEYSCNHDNHQENDGKIPSSNQRIVVLEGGNNCVINLKNNSIIDEVTDPSNEQILSDKFNEVLLSSKSSYHKILSEELVLLENNFKKDDLITEQDVTTSRQKVMNNSLNNRNLNVDSSCRFNLNENNKETNSILFSDCFINNDLKYKYRVKVLNDQSSNGSRINRTNESKKKRIYFLMPVSKSKKADKLNVYKLFTMIRKSQEMSEKRDCLTNINGKDIPCKIIKFKNINVKRCLSLNLLNDLSGLKKENTEIKNKTKALPDNALDKTPLIKPVPDNSITMTNSCNETYKDGCKISSSEPLLSEVNDLNSEIFLQLKRNGKHKSDKAVSDNFFKKLIRKMAFDLSSVVKSNRLNNNPFSKKVLTYKDVYKEKLELNTSTNSSEMKEKIYDWMKDRNKYDVGFCYTRPKFTPINGCTSFLRQLHRTGDMKVKRNLKIDDSELSKHLYISKNNKNSINRSNIYQNSYKSKHASNSNKPLNIYWNLQYKRKNTSIGNFFRRRENYMNNLPVSKQSNPRKVNMSYKIYNENRKLGLSDKSNNIVSGNKFISYKKVIPFKRNEAHVTDYFGKKYIKKPTSIAPIVPRKTKFARTSQKENYHYFSRKHKWGLNQKPTRSTTFSYGLGGDYRNNFKKSSNLYQNVKSYKENIRNSSINFDGVFVSKGYSSPNFRHEPEPCFVTNKIPRSQSCELPKDNLYLFDQRQLKIGDKNIFIPNFFRRSQFSSSEPIAHKGKHSSAFLEKLKRYADAEFKWKKFDYVAPVQERNYGIKNYPEFKRDKFISEIFREKNNKSHNFDGKSKLISLGIDRRQQPKPYQKDLSKLTASKISAELSPYNYLYPFDHTSTIDNEINKTNFIKQSDIFMKTEKNKYLQNLTHTKSTGFNNKPESWKTPEKYTTHNFHGHSSYVKEKINRKPKFRDSPKSFSDIQFSNSAQSHSDIHTSSKNNLVVFLRRTVVPPAVDVKDNNLLKFYNGLKNINESDKGDKKSTDEKVYTTNVTPLPSRIPTKLNSWTPILKIPHRNCLVNESDQISSAVNNKRELSKNKCVSTQLYYSKLKPEGHYSNKRNPYTYRKQTITKEKSDAKKSGKILKGNVIQFQKISKKKSGVVLDKIKEMGDLFIKSNASENAVISNVIEGNKINKNICTLQKDASNIRKDVRSSTGNKRNNNDTKKTATSANLYKKNDVKNFNISVSNVIKSAEEVNGVNKNLSGLLFSEKKLQPKSDISIRDNLTYRERNSNKENSWFYKNNKNKITFNKLISKKEGDSLLSEKQQSVKPTYSEMLNYRYFDDQNEQKEKLHRGKLKESGMPKEMKLSNDDYDDFNLLKKQTEFNYSDSLVDDKSHFMKEEKAYRSSIPIKVDEKLDFYKEGKKYVSDHSLIYLNSIKDVKSKYETENSEEDGARKFSYAKRHSGVIQSSNNDNQEQSTSHDLKFKTKYTTLGRLNTDINQSKVKSKNYPDLDTSASSYNNIDNIINDTCGALNSPMKNNNSTKKEKDKKCGKSDGDPHRNKKELYKINDICSFSLSSSENSDKTSKMVHSFGNKKIVNILVNDDLLNSDHCNQVTKKEKSTDKIKLKNFQPVKQSKLKENVDYEKIKLSCDKKNSFYNNKKKTDEREQSSKLLVKGNIPTKHYTGEDCSDVSSKAKGNIIIKKLFDYNAKTIHKSGEPTFDGLENISVAKGYVKQNATISSSNIVKDYVSYDSKDSYQTDSKGRGDFRELNSEESGDLVYNNNNGESVLGSEIKLSTSQELVKGIEMNKGNDIRKDTTSCSDKLYPQGRPNGGEDGLEVYSKENHGELIINKYQKYNSKTNREPGESFIDSSEKSYSIEVNVKKNALTNNIKNDVNASNTFNKSLIQNISEKNKDLTLNKTCRLYSDRNITANNSRSAQLSNTKTSDEFLDHFKNRSKSKSFDKISIQSDQKLKNTIPQSVSLKVSCGLMANKEEDIDKSINDVAENNFEAEFIESCDSNSIESTQKDKETVRVDPSHLHFKNNLSKSLLIGENIHTIQQAKVISLQKEKDLLPGLNRLSDVIKSYAEKSNELISLDNCTDAEKSPEELLDNFGKLIVDKRKLAMDLYGTITSACKKSLIKSRESLSNNTYVKESLSSTINDKEPKFSFLSKSDNFLAIKNNYLKDHSLLNCEKTKDVDDSMNISSSSLNNKINFDSVPSTPVLKNKIKELNNETQLTKELKRIKNYPFEKREDKCENISLNDFKGIKKDSSFENDFFQSMKMVDHLQNNSYPDVRLRAIKNELIKIYSRRDKFLSADSKSNIDSASSQSAVTVEMRNEHKDPVRIQLKDNSSANTERVKTPQNKVNRLSDAMVLDNMNNLSNKSNYYYKKYGDNSYNKIVSNINKKMKSDQSTKVKKENDSHENSLANQKYLSDYNNDFNYYSVSDNNKIPRQVKELDSEKSVLSVRGTKKLHCNRLTVYNKKNTGVKLISDHLEEDEEEAEEEENVPDHCDIVTLYYDKSSKKIKILAPKSEDASEEFDETDDDIDCYKKITPDFEDLECFKADGMSDEEKVKFSNFNLINSCKNKVKNIEASPNHKSFDFWRNKITTSIEQSNLDDEMSSVIQENDQILKMIPEMIPESLLKMENFVLTKNKFSNYRTDKLKPSPVFQNLNLCNLKHFITPNPYLKSERLITKSNPCDENNDTEYIGTMAITLKDSFKNANIFTFIDSLQFSISAQKILNRFLKEKRDTFLGKGYRCTLPDNLNKITFESGKKPHDSCKILTVPKPSEKVKPSVKLDFGTLSVVLEANDVVRSPLPFIKSLNITVEDDENFVSRIENENIEINNDASAPELTKMRDLLKYNSKSDQYAEFFNSLVFLKNIQNKNANFTEKFETFCDFSSRISQNKNANFTEKFETFCDFPSRISLLLKPNQCSSKSSSAKECLHFKETFMENVVNVLQSKSVELDKNKIKSKIPRFIPIPDAQCPQIPSRNSVPIEDTVEVKDKNYSCDYIFQDPNNVSTKEDQQFEDNLYKLRSTTPLDKLTDFPLINEEKIKMRYQSDKIINIAYSDTSHIVTTVRLPSVTKILNDTMSETSKAVLEQWRKRMIAELGETQFEVLNKAKLQQGSDFHNCIKDYLMGTPLEELKAEQPPVINHLLKSANSVLHRISDIAVVESRVVHSKLPYKGFVDCVAIYNGKPTLIEWKHSDKKKPYISSTYDAPIQLSAYLGALNYDDHYKLPVENGMVIVAYTDGSPADEFWLTIDSCDYYWKRWLERLHQFLASKTKS